MPIKLFIYAIFFIFIFSYKNLHSTNISSNIKHLTEKPYKIKGKWHYPNNNLNYNEIGIVSVNKKKKNYKTKNGEIFSNNEIVAKHKTLSLPTIVRVTNLNNGYSINVRINDRGPRDNFKIMEISKRTAKFLNISEKGLVEIKVVKDLTLQEQKRLKNKDSISYDENLEKNIALKSFEIETENLMNNDVKNNKKDVKSKKKERKIKKLKLNFKKKKAYPFYLRIQIGRFNNFKDARNLKIKMKPIYDKILISLILINKKKYYNLTTIPITDLNEAENLLKIINKKGFKNAKLFIERKKI